MAKKKTKKRSKPYAKCRTKFCRGVAWKHCKNVHCPKCVNRRWRERNPLRYFFNKLRYRARERGKVFTITFEYYCQLVLASGYLEKKGKTASSLSLNRINDALGYVPGNIEVITLSENSRKAWVPYYRQLKEEAEAAMAALTREETEPF